MWLNTCSSVSDVVLTNDKVILNWSLCVQCCTYHEITEEVSLAIEGLVEAHTAHAVEDIDEDETGQGPQEVGVNAVWLEPWQHLEAQT